MPEYLFENPKTGEIISVIQGIDEEHAYSEEGKEFSRVFTIPNASIDSSPDPFSSQRFGEKTKNMKGSMGDMWDYSKELSQKRKEIVGGEDPVRKKSRERLLKKKKRNEIQGEGLRRNIKNDSNVIDEVAITYLSKLLNTSEKTVKSLTDNEEDSLLIIKQASKKRLNKRTLKKLHPKISSLLMIFREGGAASLTDKEMTFLSDALYRYFFRLKNEDVKACLKHKKENEIENQIKSYTICFMVTTLHAACLEEYWKGHMSEADLPKAMQFYEEYSREGFKDCEIDINLDNCKEVLETVKEKYL